MTTNTPGSTARQDPRQVSNTMRYEFNFATPGLAAGVQIGILPQGAFITGNFLEIVQAFNAGTTNPITFGSVGAAYNNLVAAGDNTPATPNVYVPAFAALKFGRGLASAGDTPIFAKYTPTGTAATTGIGVFVLEFEGNFPG